MIDEKLLTAIDDYHREPKPERLELAVRELGTFLYLGLKRFRIDYLTEDSRSDFIAWLYPRLSGIIRNYNEDRSSFNTYITWVIRLSWRTFWRNQYSRDACQRVLETEAFTTLLSVEADRSNAENWNTCTADTGEDYGDASGSEKPSDTTVIDKKEVITKRSAKKKEMEARKVFLLACKAGNFLDESAIEKIAKHTGYAEDYIRSTIAIIQNRCKKKRDRMQYAREQQNSCYIRAQKCLFEMKYLDRGTTRYDSLEKEYRYCINRLDRLKAQAGRQIRSPSNRFIAATLGMSRGTVDAALAAALQGEYSDTP